MNLSIRNSMVLQWNCDHCGKPSIIMSGSGMLYCDNCKMSHGFNIKEWYKNKVKQEIKNE